MSREFLLHCLRSAHAANSSGQYRVAVAWCKQAVAIDRAFSEGWYHLGLALRGAGERKAAIDALLQAARLESSNADAQNSIGLELIELQAYAEAEHCLAQAVRLNPDFAYAHNSIGLLCQAQARLSEARSAFEKVVRLCPNLAAAHANLAGILNASNLYARAEQSARKAVEIEPGSASAWVNLGVALSGLKQHAAAEAAARRAIALMPDSAEAWGNLGMSLARQFRSGEATEACERAMSLDPHAYRPHVTLAGLLMQQGRFDEASAQFELALEKSPGNSDILSSRLFNSNYLSHFDAQKIVALARAYAQPLLNGGAPFTVWSCPPVPQRRLRIGMVSGDFRSHPVGYFLQGPLLEIERTNFELVAYSNHPQFDAVTERLRQSFSAWIDVWDMDDAALARRIHADQIDILIDLSGHTDYNRLPVFALKPAPVQVTWLGYFGTTGLDTIDWKIGDPWVTPPAEANHFVERVWTLPSSCFCFTPPDSAPDVLPAPSNANGYVTFGCFNNIAKINERTIRVWSRILHAVPDSKLFLKSKELRDEQLCQSLRDRFRQQGIDDRRLMLEADSSYPEYLAAYGRVDMALDPFPYCGGATTVDGLWMGVPLVTLKGDRFIAHQGESLLHAAGLADWIADDEDAYVSLASQHAQAPGMLSLLRADMRARISASPLVDAIGFADSLEAAWRGMWQQWCESQKLPV